MDFCRGGHHSGVEGLRDEGIGFVGIVRQDKAHTVWRQVLCEVLGHNHGAGFGRSELLLIFDVIEEREMLRPGGVERPNIVDHKVWIRVWVQLCASDIRDLPQCFRL